MLVTLFCLDYARWRRRPGLAFLRGWPSVTLIMPDGPCAAWRAPRASAGLLLRFSAGFVRARPCARLSPSVEGPARTYQAGWCLPSFVLASFIGCALPRVPTEGPALLLCRAGRAPLHFGQDRALCPFGRYAHGAVESELRVPALCLLVWRDLLCFAVLLSSLHHQGNPAIGARCHPQQLPTLSMYQISISSKARIKASTNYMGQQESW